jgi:LysM repeat protein
MKLIHVTGFVVAVHAAVFVVIFATPGCRSTGRPNALPTPEATAPTAVSPVVDTIRPIPVQGGDLDQGTPVSPVSPVSPTASSAPASDGMVHFTPTRPSIAPVVEPAAAGAPTATHTVAKGDSLWSVAHKYGITLDELAAANQLAKKASLHVGQTLIVPSKAAAASSPSDASNTYAVVSGDTIGGIARKQGTTPSALRAANNMKGDTLRIGQKLVIPGNATPVDASAAAPAASVAPAHAAPRAGDATHTVAPGDSLGSIARKHGVRLGDLATLNNITDPGKIRVGQVLKLPVGAKAVAAAVAAPSAKASAPAAVEKAPAPAAPAEPTPVQPMAVPVIRID